MCDVDRPPVLQWRTSSFSDDNGGQCVEVAFDGDAVLVRDTKQQGRGPVLAFTRREWAAFLAGARDGEFNRT